MKVPAGLFSILLISIVTISTSIKAQQVTVPYKETTYGAPPYTRTYFLPQHTGKLRVVLNLQSAKNDQLKVQLGAEGKTYIVKIKKSDVPGQLPVGEFALDRIAYQYIGITSLSKKSQGFPVIENLTLSGPAAEGLQFNNSEYRGAPATHLSYPLPDDTEAECFYTEIKVPKDAQAMHSYYMTNGFNGGYMGIQINSPTERRVLFSIWSAYKTDDPRQIPADFTVKLVRKGEEVHGGEFGNEGSGGQTFLRYNWKADTIYKLLVKAKAAGDHTIYTGYFFAPEQGKWKLIGQWDKPKTGGHLLHGLYSFVENFGEDGEEYFKAMYGNQWVRLTDGKWVELNKAKFSTTADPVKHPRFDYGGGAAGNWFYMFSGGFKYANTSKKGDVYTRQTNNITPDLSDLPKD